MKKITEKVQNRMLLILGIGAAILSINFMLKAFMMM